MAEVVCEAKVCEVGGGGLILPPSYENEWDKRPRAVLYLLLLFWFFMGVAIVADVFMGAIEKVTSKKRTFVNKKTMTVKTVRVWNDTVANLTLMALGSSAPEILLNVIEIIAGEFKLGKLGPSTIVGSAAFNLLMISAVCVIAIPSSEVRYIKDTQVYCITATFSVFAYVWLLLIVKFITPEVVDVWEAVVTFLLFPLLTLLAYLADIGKFSGKSVERVDFESLSNEEYSHYEMKILMKYGNSLPDEEIARLMQQEYGNGISRAAYRVNATRRMVGAKRVDYVETTTTHGSQQVVPITGDEAGDAKKVATIEFMSGAYTVIESIGELELTIHRKGCLDGTVKVGYKTRDGTAEGGKDFEIREDTAVFNKDEHTVHIKIPIINDTDLEKDEYFFVDLMDVKVDNNDVKAEWGMNKTAEIRIIDDDDPGMLCFKDSMIKVKEGVGENTRVFVHVDRRNGSRGDISVNYRTEDDSAAAGTDYEEASGTLQFEDGQAEGIIEIVILPRGRYESEEKFRVILEEPENAKLMEAADHDTTTCTIIIESDADARDRVDRVVKALQINWDKNKLGTANWKEQFSEALLVNGGEEDEPVGISDYIMHALTVFWKVLFACIPPADYCDGWLCFCIALVMIGVVTAFIGDLANLVGCCVGLPAEITAITIVALGTSLPDTFASMTAAKQDPYADASVGNVTGSNSVNVFLGLGLPWTIASVYWAAKDSKFDVPSGNLAISVGTFCGCALCAILLLYIRRVVVGGELGGNATVKWISFCLLVSLWLVYIVVSSIVVVNNLGDCD